jgi:EAL domain-containing protein (putative c-di-GMP-specific phosphodiesterase class I)
LQTIASALHVVNLPPSRLEIEITESALLNDTAAVLAMLNELKAIGVMIALDDFGTGYSSLSYIRKFPLDIVKIDRSFLAGVEIGNSQDVLLRGISRLCHELGLSVTVEGIETDAQLDLVCGIPEIQIAQGFLFSKPAPADHIRQLLDAVTPGNSKRSADGNSAVRLPEKRQSL